MEDFSEIRPYEAGEMKEAFEALLADRQFNLIMKGFAPWLPQALRNGLLRLAFKGVSKTSVKYAKSKGLPVLDMPGDDFGDAYEAFFDQIKPDDPE